MAAYNLVRNTRVFFTTNVDATTGVIPTSGATISNTNTYELLVLNGFSFTQTTQQQTITLNEAGNTPTRGQRSFNTSLDPVEFSFSTYIRPSGTTTIAADESVLWNALMSDKAIDTTGLALTVSAFTRAASAATVTVTATAANFTTANIAVGDVVNVTGVTGTDAMEWNTPATVAGLSPSATAATSITLVYATAPAGAATAPVSAPTSINLKKGSWVSLPAASPKPAYAMATTAGSNKNQLQKFGMYFSVDGAIYAIDNCVLDQASIDFSLDGIAMVAWTGKGTALRQLPSTSVLSGTPAVFSGAGNATGTAASANSSANFITNKLSTAVIQGGIQGNGTTYTVALTGGNLTISNNVTYVTPENIGVVNKPVGYFTGTRSISGNVTAYLKTGTNNSAQILSDILTANAAETKFRMMVEVGGGSNSVHADFDMDGCMLQVPTVETADIMSTTINFTAQGTDPLLASQAYDLSGTNDLFIRYYSA